MTELPVSRAENTYDLLQDVKRIILEEPKRFRMDTYVSVYKGDLTDFIPLPRCGTVCCIGGWMIVARGLIDGDPCAQRRGIETILEETAIPPGMEWAFRNELFYNFDPFYNFDTFGSLQAGSPEYAAVGARLIDEFLDKHGDQLRAHRIVR